MKAKFINEALENILNNLKIEINQWFKERAIIPDEYEIEKISATELWNEELKRVKEDELEYYEDFEDDEIPLITSDVYAAAYEYNLKTQKFKIIDSYMQVEDFNYLFLKTNINEFINYVIVDVYGYILWINKI